MSYVYHRVRVFDNTTIYNDFKCRLCGEEEEGIEHVLNRCPELSQFDDISDIYSNNEVTINEIIRRPKEFVQKSKQ